MPLPSQAGNPLSKRIRENIVKVKKNDLIGPGVTTCDFYDQLENAHYGCGGGKSKPITKHLPLLSMSRSIKLISRKISSKELSIIRKEIIHRFMDTSEQVHLANPNLLEWFKKFKIPQFWRPFIIKIDQEAGAPIIEEWIRFQFGEGNFSDYPKLLKFRSLFRLILAIDYLQVGLDVYRSPVVSTVNVGGQIFSDRKKFLYGAADFIRTVELELKLEKRPDTPLHPNDRLYHEQSFYEKLDFLKQRDTVNKKKSLNELLNRKKANEMAVKVNTPIGSFEDLETEDAKNLIDEIQQGFDLYVIHAAECNDFLSASN